MTRPIRILLVDDDDRFRRVYGRLFEATEGMRVVGEAASVAQAVAMVRGLTPDVALIDVQLPDGSGLQVVAETAGTTTRAVVLTTFDLDEYVQEALHQGAAGFLLKNASCAEVVAAVRAVQAGHASLAPEVTARFIPQIRARRPIPHAFTNARLSERELQVVRLVAAGCSNQVIADELCLSLPTVRTYLRRMFLKLDVNDRTQLAVLAYEAGLLHEHR